ncbi:lipopolysaccharide biosynthesis protein [Pisciglobus halotolerans]|uniref:Membrane protein involved in the export of O-antigen and teichoic acid n=1 Tax=Pisciglobus halotolerans TaxID=745365 RepID=A0A1I3DKL0_9LACT|nr:hypothetical protein [Pisciglobus halotolerans]SFH87270.1 hypothetical protein SAMN04489868_1423 [Pisciglobus halotolerans]
MKKNIIKRAKNFVKDISLNIISNLMVIGVTQIIINPFLAANFGTNKFGVMLSITGIATIFSSVFGTALNNTRLINDQKYRNNKIKGDFNLLLIIGLLISLIISSSLIYYYSRMISLENTLIVIYILLSIVRSYIQVFYRLTLHFDKLIKESIAVILGYLVGILFSSLLGQWVFTYLLGEIAGVLYLTVSVKWHKEPFKRTPLWNQTIKNYSQLGFTNVIASSLTYLDRILILPFLGASSVSIYYIATIVGKMGSFVATPLSNMTLSYLANVEVNKVSKYFKNIIVFTLVFGITAYLLLLVATPFVLSLLYSDEMIIESLKIYKVTNIVIILQMINTIIRPLIMKYCPSRWLISIQMTGLLTYITSALLMMNNFGLFGYCIAAVLTQIILYGMNVTVLYKYLK